MKGSYIKLVMMVALAAGGLFTFWSVASADNPTPPGGGSLPSGHGYYQVFEAKYRVHNLRLEDCLLCHTTDAGTGQVNGMNAYGADLVTELQATVPETAYGNDPTNEDGAGPGTCSDTIDNGPDGLTDGDDPDCSEIQVQTGLQNAHVIIYDALNAIGGLDSDGDGQPNGYEITALSFPGDDTDYYEPVPAAPIAGPHGGYLTDGASYNYAPFQCATCHRTHTADAPILLTSEPWGDGGLCETCHSGMGALTDVEDGVNTSSGNGIHGGGFVNAVMDTDVDGVELASSGSITSSHTVDGTAGLMWGSLSEEQDASGAGKLNVTLDCGNCHDPHGAAIGYGENPLDDSGGNINFADALAAGRITLNYRMLQPNPIESGDYDGGQPMGPGRLPFMMSVPDGGLSGGSYDQAYRSDDVEGTANDVIRPDTTYQPNDRLVDWCSICHTNYQRLTVTEYDDGHSSHEAITERQDEGDPFNYGHATSEATCSTTSGCHGGYSTFSRPKCLDCHVSHGTSAVQTIEHTPPDCLSCHQGVGTGNHFGDACDSCHGPDSAFGPGPKHAPWPGGATPGGSGQPDEGNERSSLLRSDNRGVCTDCHQK